MATLTVAGRGSVSVPTDEASLSLEVEALRDDAAAALDDVAGRVRELVALLDGLGVGAEARATTGLSVAEVGEHDRDGRYVRRGFRASEQLTVRVGDAALLGRVLGEAVAQVDARAQGPWWSVSRTNPARLDVLRAAAVDARGRAAALAEGLELRLGSLVEAVEAGAQPPQPRGAVRMAALTADVPVEAGTATVEAAISATFEVEPA